MEDRIILGWARGIMNPVSKPGFLFCVRNRWVSEEHRAYFVDFRLSAP
jgi:hypothetical protein